MLNDYTYITGPANIFDRRWVHRSRKRWETREDLTDQDTLEWRFFHEMAKLLNLRKKLPALQNGGLQIIETGNPLLLGYILAIHNQEILNINNFSEEPQKMDVVHLDACGARAGVVNLQNGEILSSLSDSTWYDNQTVWLDISRQ